MLTFRFDGAAGQMIRDGILTSGMVGQEIALEFSSEWNNMSKTVVFTAGDVTRDVVDVTSKVITIPAEVLAKPYNRLRVGIYGVAPNGQVTPTIYVNGPVIHPGTDPSGDPGTAPELPVWAQIQQAVEALKVNSGTATNTKNVRSYGAAGDGTTDDTAAIAAAIAALEAGDTLYFPEGVYRVSNINLKSDMTVQGAGWCSVIRLLDATTDYHGRNNCLNIENVSNIIIRDIQLDGTRTTQQSTAPAQDARLNGIHIRHASDILVENVWMYNNGYHGCIMTYASNVAFRHCRVTDNGFRPIHGHTKIYNCRVSNCVCENNGLGLTGGSGFENDSIFFFGAQHLAIHDNIVKSNRRGCITVGSEQDSTGEDVIPTRNITISGNTCECYEDLVGIPADESDTEVEKFSSQGIVVYGGKYVLKNVSIIGNTIRNAHEAIKLFSAERGELASAHTIISGNTIMDCSYGVYATDSADVTLADNRFSGLAVAGMYAKNIAGWQIHGNNINAPGISDTRMFRIHESKNIVIRDNNFVGDCAMAVYAPAPNPGFVVANNTMYGFTAAEPVLNPDGAAFGNICDAALEEDTATAKICVDPYENAGFVRPSMANPNTGSNNWRYTTPVALTDADTGYELNTYVNVPVAYGDPAEYNPLADSPAPSAITAIVFMAGPELVDTVGICTVVSGNCAVAYSRTCIDGASKNIWGVRLSITAEQVRELFPTATHVMMQVENAFSVPEDLGSVYHILGDGHAYVCRTADYATEQFVREYAQPKGDYALAKDVPDDDHINALINEALGVIENGSY